MNSSQFTPTPRFISTPTDPAKSRREEAIEESGSSFLSQGSISEEESNSKQGIDTKSQDVIHGLSASDDEDFRDNDDFDDLLAGYENRRRRSMRTKQSEPFESLSADRSTLHPRKKQRLQKTLADSIYISSSPSPERSPTSYGINDVDYQEKIPKFSLDHSNEPSVAVARNPEKNAFKEPFGTSKTESRSTETIPVPRFRSTLEATPYSPFPVIRPAFVRPEVPTRPDSSGVSTIAANLLPDVFSPSKRRGRGKEYLHGGMAKTMLDMVLAMGQEEENRWKQIQHRQKGETTTKSRLEYEVISYVAEARREDNLQTTVVHDCHGQKYLLIGDPANGAARISVGSCIAIRKGHLWWKIENPVHNITAPVDNHDKAASQDQMIVSASWDLDPRFE